jgi:hypothetical protein
MGMTHEQWAKLHEASEQYKAMPEEQREELNTAITEIAANYASQIDAAVEEMYEAIKELRTAYGKGVVTAAMSYELRSSNPTPAFAQDMDEVVNEIEEVHVDAGAVEAANAEYHARLAAEGKTCRLCADEEFIRNDPVLGALSKAFKRPEEV